MNLLLRNPHSVLAALESRPGDVLEVAVPTKSATEAWERVVALAKSKGIRVSQQVRGAPEAAGGRGASAAGGARQGSRQDFRGGGPSGRSDARVVARPNVAPGSGPDLGKNEGGRSGGGEATVRERASITAEELFRGARERADGKGLWLALDCLTDPHNVGAIFRAAGFFGVQGILLTQERSAPLTATVYDVASGGLESVPFVLQTNLQRGFEVAKEAGLWILGTSEHAQEDLSTVSLDRPWLAVLGNEEKGMRRLTEENCDVLCAIKPRGAVTSLNVSVAAGILIGRLTGAV